MWQERQVQYKQGIHRVFCSVFDRMEEGRGVKGRRKCCDRPQIIKAKNKRLNSKLKWSGPVFPVTVI